MNITDLEQDVIRAIADNQYANSPDDSVWSWAIEYHTKITKTEQISGVVSSLVKKGLACSEDYGTDRIVRLTVKGVEEYNRLKED